ncbi:hypothetical protein PoB_005079600 [Plakobranchus ocellatus]|uniref:Uncharacterized protein n=1 Tax=Plakobranchus ocellatus TaxID=259542 RepID=A0AAV4BUW0_9GAST|nr:hypothetical protein PoB_005079600 [Plakobranchus ocellatus]
MSRFSGPLTPSTFPSMTSQIASGMHNDFTSQHRQGVLWLTTALLAGNAALAIFIAKSSHHSVNFPRSVPCASQYLCTRCHLSRRLLELLECRRYHSCTAFFAERLECVQYEWYVHISCI